MDNDEENSFFSEVHASTICAHKFLFYLGFPSCVELQISKGKRTPKFAEMILGI